MNVEPEVEDRFPFTFNVPPLTVSVPLLASGVLFKVHPTVKSPDETVNVPPELMVKFRDTFAAEFTVTL